MPVNPDKSSYRNFNYQVVSVCTEFLGALSLSAIFRGNLVCGPTLAFGDRLPDPQLDDCQRVVVLRLGVDLEGLLALPEGVIVKSIQARVLEKGQVRIARSVTLKDAAHVRS